MLHRLRPRTALTRGFALALILASPFGPGAMPAARGGELQLIAGDRGDAAVVDGSIAVARFNGLAGIAVDGPGNVYVADGQTIRRISTSGAVTTIAGQAGEWGDSDGAGTSARFNNPQGLAADAAGNVYVADRDNHTIRKITRTGVVTTIAGLADHPGSDDGSGATARFNSLGALAIDRPGNVYASDFAYIQSRAATRYVKPGPSATVRRIDAVGMVSTLAGRATDLAASADGVGAAARFKSPSGIAADRAGTLYVADTTANTVRKITAAGQVTTLAGKTGVRGHIDGLGVAALFDGPSGIAVDSSGTRDGLVSTLAGTAGVRGSVDGMGTAAQFSTPTGIAIDGDGNLFVTDEWANNIRKVTPAGEVTTVANKTGQHGSIDGPAEQPRFVVPTGIAIDHAGNLYVCDYGNRTIRKITPGGVVTTVAGVAEQSGIKVGKLPGRLENTSGLAFIDSNTLVATERFSVLKILLNDR